ncbi:hypothetical protein HDU96_005130, partial [Phlyctochytrium bullatum]
MHLLALLTTLLLASVATGTPVPQTEGCTQAVDAVRNVLGPVCSTNLVDRVYGSGPCSRICEDKAKNTSPVIDAVIAGECAEDVQLLVSKQNEL